jgi:hypothetical protein
MGELKSAWEIAQEKASKLGKLSAEEIRQQMEQRCQQLGNAIAQRYLDHENQDLVAELKSYTDEEKELLTKAIIAQLIQAIDLTSLDTARLDKILRGISGLEPEWEPGIAQIRELFQESQQAEEKIRQEIEREGREILHQMRVSGTAVSQINPLARAAWQESRLKVIQPFEERWQQLKQELL